MLPKERSAANRRTLARRSRAKSRGLGWVHTHPTYIYYIPQSGCTEPNRKKRMSNAPNPDLLRSKGTQCVPNAQQSPIPNGAVCGLRWTRDHPWGWPSWPPRCVKVLQGRIEKRCKTAILLLSFRVGFYGSPCHGKPGPPDEGKIGAKRRFCPRPEVPVSRVGASIKAHPK